MQGLYVIEDLESLKRFSGLKSYDHITRLRIKGYDDINKLRIFSLFGIPANQGLILEFIDCQYSLDKIIDDLNLQDGAIGTVRYKFTRQYQRPVNTLQCKGRKLPFERLIVDFGAKIDCEELRVQQLVLYNLLSATHLSKASSLDTLVIVHSFNVHEDEEVRPGAFELPSAPGLKTLIIPESQEFKYEVTKTVIPDIIGIIPSSYYPSRFACGIQQAREPISKSNIPEIVYEVFAQSHS
jgi:hypothetical protein